MQLGSTDHGITSTGVKISKRLLIPLKTELPCPPDTSSCRITCKRCASEKKEHKLNIVSYKSICYYQNIKKTKKKDSEKRRTLSDAI